ncbi:hypothetical protein AB0F11_34910 [Streptomyces sp. NPDC032472]|uniref:hypothetical protein n=1 Tax=Streptomyces sp. NPDC032472 TaxID=3155018 RepID=UPI0033F228BA
MDMDVDAVITELYGLRPAQFIEARDRHAARAKRAKDTEAARRIGRLRKPTLALWAVNLLARSDPDGARALLDLGARLRTAHRELDGRRLRALSEERNKALAELTRRAA